MNCGHDGESATRRNDGRTINLWRGVSLSVSPFSADPKVPEKHGAEGGRLYVTAHTHGSCRYVILFLCLKRPSSSVGALWGTTGLWVAGRGGGTTRPRQMFRDAWVPFASAYYVLGICTYVRRATRDRFPMTCHAPVILDPRRDDDVDDGRARALQRNDDPRCTMSREGDWS